MRSNASIFARSLATGAIGVAALMIAAAQDPQPPAETPAPSPPSKQPETSPPPSLDELLGLKKDKPADEQEPSEIIEKLTGEEQPAAGADIAAMFLEAVDSMGKSASLLLDERSAGLATQRYQEQAMLKLDTLIAQAQQQSQQQSQPQNQQSQQQQAPQQQEGQPTNPSGQTNTSQVGDHNMALQQRNLDGAIDETRSEWGNLPPRVRDLLRQGRGDAAARLYQRLTEIYYQRLAEESQP